MRKNLKRGCRNLVGKYRWLARGIVLMGAMAWSLAAGAVTIREVVNSSPALCKQFVGILKAADVPHMTDAQLCKFHFDQLPPSVTKGFTFPHWKKLKVSDPLEMYKQMVLANWPSNIELGAPPQAFFAGFKGMYKTYELLRQAAHEQAIRFYTATVPARSWSGLGSSQSDALKQLPAEFHFVRMYVDFCHNKDFRFLGQDYAASYRPGLKEPVDAADLDGGVIALWHGGVWQISAGPTLWSRPLDNFPLSIDFSVSYIDWHPSGYSNPSQQPIRAGFSHGPTVCSYSITK